MKIVSVEFEKRCRHSREFPRFPLPEIAFAGRSNVGKSSLINTLLHRRRLVGVSSTPGKTRSIDFFRINEAFRFVDLPGYGYARISKAVQGGWKKLIEDYLVNRESLVSVVWILDIRRDLSELDRMLLDWLCSYSIPYIPVCTKADKVPLGERIRRREALGRVLDQAVELVLFSAKTGLGKDALWKRMRAALSNRPAPRPFGMIQEGLQWMGGKRSKARAAVSRNGCPRRGREMYCR